jgi:glyoxylase-like metal-dependent hydrolase (beta-lactamase superfamily II)
MTEFVEVGDRVWVARHEWFDLNVTVIAGTRGLVVVDTHASEPAGRAVAADVRRLARGEVIGIINTHQHFDHTFGNGALRAAFGEVPITAHETAAANTISAGERIKREYAEAGVGEEPRGPEVIGTRIVPADDTFSSSKVLDLGDRILELVHPGRGHTAGDLVVRVPDVDVLLAGDLIEESAPPGYGPDCWPMEWPTSLDLVLQLMSEKTVVVPGHGAVTDKDFVWAQRNDIGVIAETIRDLAGRGVPVDQAPAAGEWPWDHERLVHAVRRGYEQLPRSSKRLPLI